MTTPKKKARVSKKKPSRIIPTPKQKALAREVLANTSKNEPMKKLMKRVGYSDGLSTQPIVVTESRGFKQALLMAGATEDRIAQVLNEGLEANRVDTIKGISEMSNTPDVALRVKTAETVAKLMGYSTEPKAAGNTYNTYLQQNNLNPNEPDQTDIVGNTLDMLMQQSKRE